MNTVHTLREYVDALRDAGILVESTVSDELAAREIHCLTYDTRALSEDALFICKGAHFRESYLNDALSRGAIAYVAEKKHNVDAPCLLVNDIRYSLVVLGQLFYNHVTDKLTSVGITGTKGKSTTAYYVRYILNDWLRAQSMPECAILSSIDNYDGKSTEESHITTPEVLELYQHFENAYESGISHLVMEASSQALKYGRVRGITYDVAAFLNIGSDHISPIEHPDFEDYFNSKLKIFDSCRFGCVNTDAKYSDRVIEYAKDRCNLITFGSHESDTVSCQHVEKRSDGLYFTVSSLKYNGEFSITMPGLFNISNALAAMAICMVLDVPEEYVRSGLRKARAAGRMQIYESRDKNVTVIVDYAHNRMSFDALYRSTKIEYPGRQIISVPSGHIAVLVPYREHFYPLCHPDGIDAELILRHAHAHIFRDQMISAVRTVLDPGNVCHIPAVVLGHRSVGQFQDPVEPLSRHPVKFTVSLQRVADILSGIDVHGAVLGADGHHPAKLRQIRGPHTGQRDFLSLISCALTYRECPVFGVEDPERIEILRHAVIEIRFGMQCWIFFLI